MFWTNVAPPPSFTYVYTWSGEKELVAASTIIRAKWYPIAVNVKIVSSSDLPLDSNICPKKTIRKKIPAFTAPSDVYEFIISAPIIATNREARDRFMFVRISFSRRTRGRVATILAIITTAIGARLIIFRSKLIHVILMAAIASSIASGPISHARNGACEVPDFCSILFPSIVFAYSLKTEASSPLESPS